MSGTEPESGPLRTPPQPGGLPPGGELSAAGTAHPQPGAAATSVGDADRGAHRFWSGRRVPAGITALLAAAGTGLLLYDVAAVRAGRPAMRWRRTLATELATRPLDDTWMIVGATGAMLLGLWLVVLAVTPGLRSLLPMRRPGGVQGGVDVHAGLARSAAALVLRDRAMRVPGVQAARIDVKRRRVTARAQAHFRDLDEVLADLDTALTDGIRRLGLAKQPKVSVRVRRPRKR
ncbi:DUF6286 domain-containing protein [Streptomyces sp. TRM64462]|uniref:DUF6286 domain-containing protein n=1 Tax=Streptomyces sp. TRM64462 TaxID=2741726 RepID=UPI001C301199|nr:DUF6286 domain-containing protein [Streptomyces sp. TRM64462]